MQLPEDLAAKVQAAMGNRSISVQSFEERFPGVFIRRKKKRDMDRCLSATSMDSWTSEVESEESMSWLLGTGTPPGSPSKRPSASGPSIGGPTSSSSLMLMGGQKMIPVMSMDRLDEANDPVVSNDWRPNVQPVRAPARGLGGLKPQTVPGATVVPLFQGGAPSPKVSIAIPEATPMPGPAAPGPGPAAAAATAPEAAGVLTTPTAAAPTAAAAPRAVPAGPSSAAPAPPGHSAISSAAPHDSPVVVPPPVPYYSHPTPHFEETEPSWEPYMSQPNEQRHLQSHQPYQYQAPLPQPHQHPQHQHLHQHQHQHQHATQLRGQPQRQPRPSQQFPPPEAWASPEGPAGGAARHPPPKFPDAGQHGGKGDGRAGRPPPPPQRAPPPQGKGRAPGQHDGRQAPGHVPLPPPAQGADAAQRDAAAAAAYLAAAVANNADNKDFNFADFFLAYMTSSKQGPADPETAHALAQQLAHAQQQQLPHSGTKRLTAAEEAEKQAVDPRKYKTRMCRNWETKGHCPYEHTCCFAHGPDELRDLTTNHKMLASIGYFSNIILLSMTNGTKPALPPHCLYQQPQMLAAPQTPEDLKRATETLPEGVRFPFQDPMPAALRGLKKEAKARQQPPAQPSATKDQAQDGQEPAATEEEGGKKRNRRRRRGKKGPAKEGGADSGSDHGGDVGA